MTEKLFKGSSLRIATSSQAFPFFKKETLVTSHVRELKRNQVLIEILLHVSFSNFDFGH